MPPPAMLALPPLAAPILGGVVAADAVANGAKAAPRLWTAGRTRNVAGVQAASCYGDAVVYLTKVVYHVRRGYPLSSFLEFPLLLAQNAAFIGLLHILGEAGLVRGWLPPAGPQERGSRRTLCVVADVAIIGALVGALFRLPTRVLPLLGGLTVPLLFSSYVARLRRNMVRRSTYQLALIPVIQRAVCSCIRVATTFSQLGGDPVVLVSHVITAAGCAGLAAQIWWYGHAQAQGQQLPGTAAASIAIAARKRRRTQLQQQKEQQLEQPPPPQQQRQQRRRGRVPRPVPLGIALMWRSLGGFGSDAFAYGEMPSSAALRTAFRAIDIDGSGQISGAELLAAIKRGFGDSRELEESVREMMLMADVDGDGFIDFQEFCNVLSCSPEEAAA